MANDSQTQSKAPVLSESERSSFYSWAEEQGYTRLNMSSEQFTEELWFDPRGKIMSADRIVREHPQWKPAVKQAVHTRPQPPAPPAASVNRSEWLRLFPTAIIAIVFVGAAQSVVASRHAESPEATLPAALAQSNDKTNLGLTVTALANSLEIRWNRQSSAILASEGGVIKITENGVTETVPVDPAQLRDGYIAYGPKTNDVNIRLVVTGKDGDRTSESVRSVAIP